jgi:2-methylcitrate dehydratase PrpD
VSSTATRRLAEFAASLRYETLPPPVIARSRELAIDWFGSAIAGGGAAPVRAIETFALSQGPASGASTSLASGRRTSAYFAAMVNAAACHVVEQDDVHNGAVYHPAAVVFPAAFALAEERHLAVARLVEAVAAGYEAGIRVGEFLGRSHYEHFHTTGTAGTIAAAVTAGRLIGLDAERMVHAMGSAGTQASGLWAFLADAAHSKQLHPARASANGIAAALLAEQGMTGAARVLEGRHGMGEAMSRDADPSRIDDALGTRWAILEVSLKWHASCRHTHPAADALLAVMQRERLKADDLARVVARVHRGAIDVLGAVGVPASIHQSKFSMGTVLGLVAANGQASLEDFDRDALSSPAVARIRERVEMVLDAEVDAYYPAAWIGKVSVETVDGRLFDGRIDNPKGDPENPLTPEEVVRKAERLVAYRGAISDSASPAAWLHRLQNLAPEQSVSSLFQ